MKIWFQHGLTFGKKSFRKEKTKKKFLNCNRAKFERKFSCVRMNDFNEGGDGEEKGRIRV